MRRGQIKEMKGYGLDRLDGGKGNTLRDALVILMKLSVHIHYQHLPTVLIHIKFSTDIYNDPMSNVLVSFLKYFVVTMPPAPPISLLN